MTVYLIVWASVIILGRLIQGIDYRHNGELSYGTVDHRRRATFFFIVVLLLLVFVAGCRYEVGSDYYAYYNKYDDYVKQFNWKTVVTLSEPGLPMIYWLTARVVNDGAACVFVANATMITLVLVVFFRNTNRLGLAVILYSLICWAGTMNGMRQSFAVAIVFCGLPFIREKKFFRFALIIFIAFLFHRSAFVLILIYFAVHRPINFQNLFVLLLISTIVLWGFDRVYEIVEVVLNKRIDATSSYWANNVNPIRVLANVMPALFFGIYFWKRHKDEAETFYLNLLFIHALISVITSNSTCIARLSMYSEPFEIIALCELSKKLGKSKRGFMEGMVILFLIFEIYEVSKNGNMVPFNWIWQR